MSLKNQITEDMKSAMKAGDKDRLKVVRLMMAAIKQVEVDSRSELDDNGVLGVLEKMVKQRRESAEMFRKGGAEDRAAAEELADMLGHTPFAVSEAAEYMCTLRLKCATYANRFKENPW